MVHVVEVVKYHGDVAVDVDVAAAVAAVLLVGWFGGGGAVGQSVSWLGLCLVCEVGWIVPVSWMANHFAFFLSAPPRFRWRLILVDVG